MRARAPQVASATLHTNGAYAGGGIPGVGPSTVVEPRSQDLPEGQRSYGSLIRKPLQTCMTAASDVWYFVRTLADDTKLPLGPEDGDQQFTTHPPKEKPILGCRLW